MQVSEQIIKQAEQECDKVNITLISTDLRFSIFNSEISTKAFEVDLTDTYYKNILKKKVSKKEPLAKAIGAGSQDVLDLTAGTLRDSFYIAALGHKVTAIERSPTVYLLLKSAVENLKSKPEFKYIYDFIQANIKLEFADAKSYLINLKSQPDVIYFDPMFPYKKKKALSQKSMQMFQLLLSADEIENKAIAAVAIKYSKKRFVTKRPLYAEALTPTVTQRYIGKSIRYDMISTV